MVSVEKSVLKGLLKLTLEYLCWSLFFNKIADGKAGIFLRKTLS